MRIKVKRIKVIEMSEEEIAKFHDLMARAKEGHTSHYAEEQLEDGSFLGVSVCEPTNRKVAKVSKYATHDNY